ncbi:hypothetical protein L1887_36030 [Cichorium endivia]|nr:hypothetical protein L1887_36030 [Cichorium endivia]
MHIINNATRNDLIDDPTTINEDNNGMRKNEDANGNLEEGVTYIPKGFMFTSFVIRSIFTGGKRSCKVIAFSLWLILGIHNLFRMMYIGSTTLGKKSDPTRSKSKCFVFGTTPREDSRFSRKGGGVADMAYPI